MKAIALLFMLLSSVFHDVAKSKDGVLSASLMKSGENHILAVKSTNLLKPDSIVLYTTNEWNIKLDGLESVKPLEGNFKINAVQKSVLIEEEILSFKVYSKGQAFEYRATDRSFFKNRLDN